MKNYQVIINKFSSEEFKVQKDYIFQSLKLMSTITTINYLAVFIPKIKQSIAKNGDVEKDSFQFLYRSNKIKETIIKDNFLKIDSLKELAEDMLNLVNLDNYKQIQKIAK